MDLSPTLDAWLTQFATTVAPKVAWYLVEGRLRVDTATGDCPLQQDWYQRRGTRVSAHPLELARRVAGAGILPRAEACLIMDAADEAPPYEAYAPEIVAALRARLLAACGLEEEHG